MLCVNKNAEYDIIANEIDDLRKKYSSCNQGYRAGNIKKVNRRDVTVPTDTVKPSD